MTTCCHGQSLGTLHIIRFNEVGGDGSSIASAIVRMLGDLLAEPDR
jgi:hypothetical protein